MTASLTGKRRCSANECHREDSSYPRFQVSTEEGHAVAQRRVLASMQCRSKKQMDRNEQSAPFPPRNNGCLEFQMQKSSPANFPRRDCGGVGARASMCGLRREEGGAYVAASRPSCKCGLGPRLVEGRKRGRGSSSDGADSI